MRRNNHLEHIAAVVTLYNSSSQVVDNVRTYINQVGKLYVVDNSDRRNDHLIAQLTALSPTVEYVSNGGNRGLGVALNKSAERAVADKFSYLLMMDDDSALPPRAVKRLYRTAGSAITEKVGIVSAAQTGSATRPARCRSNAPTPVLTTITAGSLLNLTAYQRVGPFQNDLFVDWVDIEYSFRLKRHGYRLLLDHRVRMTHRIGVMKRVKLLGFINFRWRSHSPVRLYYKFRNSLFVMNREGENIPSDFRRRFRRELRRNLFWILIAEPNKREFFVLIRKAIQDARDGRLGQVAYPASVYYSSPPSTEKMRSVS